MKRSGWVRAILTTAAVVLVLVPAASAATPQQIYADLADNGKLDQKYSKSDLDAAVHSAVVQGYGEQGPQNVLPQEAGQAGGEVSGVLPFTGLDLVLIVGFGVTMLLIGTALRRVRPTTAR